jgi:ribosomal-protein-alanine N-acetyltransferase
VAPDSTSVIEDMTNGDLDRVVEIEVASSPSPWSRNVFVEELARDFAHVLVVREAPGARALAFLNFWTVADEIHILNVATDPAHRCQGHASALLSHAVARARRTQARVLTLEVRRSNQAAQSLYRRFGFRAIGVRAAYYADNQEDALVMLLDVV